MLNDVEAIYENGVFRPLTPVALPEQEQVTLTVVRAADADWLDTEFMDACASDADVGVTLDQVRASLAKICGSMDVAIDDDRGDH
jgi:predicted DNA-binding antitoxin AbrB/MazE fold protein